MRESLEPKWVDCFERAFRLNGVGPGQMVAILSESLSRPVLVELAEHGLHRCGARIVHIRVPSPPQRDPVPVRSTGSSYAFDDYAAFLRTTGVFDLVVDCSVEGLLHSRARQEILAAGGRVFMISNEHPEVLERCPPDAALHEKAMRAVSMLQAASAMRVTSAAGTDLTINVKGAPCRGGAGVLGPGDKIAYWPAGLCLCFPLEGSVNGTVVLDVGDVNLTFKRYFESRVRLVVENDFVVAVEGDGLDAELMRSYYAGWNDPLAYTISHVGWGLNPGARWDALVMYDKADINGTEFRALAGSFLISTGANEFADRFTGCHFDLPMRNCTVALDGVTVVDKGVLQPPFA